MKLRYPIHEEQLWHMLGLSLVCAAACPIWWLGFAVGLSFCVFVLLLGQFL